MDKKSILKSISNTAYNVGFGAKKHFASFDIIEKVPSFIGFLVMAIGILQIAYPDFCYNKEVSIFLIIIGLSTLYLMYYASSKNEYDKNGKQLTIIFNELRDLYYSVKNSTNDTFKDEYFKLKSLEKTFHELSLSNQVFFSDWFAHYKFFYQMQIDWIDEQKKFSFLKDKIPKTFFLFILLILSVIILIVIF